jgi:hypothetical protein
MSEPRQPATMTATPGTPAQYGGGQASPGREPANLGDILERVLDKGIVIAGDIRVNLLDIELLTIKLRLLIVSVETARELGIDWWEHDPWLTGGGEPRELEEENRRLRERIADLEDERRAPELEGGVEGEAEGQSARREVEAPRKRPAGRRASGSRRRHG